MMILAFLCIPYGFFSSSKIPVGNDQMEEEQKSVERFTHSNYNSFGLTPKILHEEGKRIGLPDYESLPERVKEIELSFTKLRSATEYSEEEKLMIRLIKFY